jgi:hypothetical protein
MDPLAQRIADAEERHVVVVVPAPVDEQPRGLVRDDDVRVDEEKIDAGHRAPSPS